MGVMMVLTYDTIFEILLREKSREELQKLDDEFFGSLREYIKEKRQILDVDKSKLDVFSFEEKEKTARQLANVYRVLKELYERREKKIVNLAMIKSRTGSDIIDTSAMLQKESALFEEAVNLLDKHRKGMLQTVTTDDFEEPEKEAKAEVTEEVAEAKPELAAVKTKLVRLLNPIPKFVGPELEIYGPFDEDDVASLPEEIANVLVTKGRAEEMEG